MACGILNILVVDGDNIFISFPNEIFPNSTILQLKNRISFETGYEIESQTLLYNNRVLENSCTLLEYGITADSYLLLANDSNLLFVNIRGTDKVMTFTFPKILFSDLTISELKFGIKNRENILENTQLLYLNGNILEDARTVGEYGIENNSCLTLVTECVEYIFVKPFTGKTITIPLTNKIFSQTKISELKSIINRNQLIPKDKQRLIFSGKELRNENTLGDYRIQPKYTLHLIAYNPMQTQISLFVKTSNGERINIEFPIKTYSQATVKELISKIELKEGTPLDVKSLYFTGRKLENTKLLSHYNIVNRSVLELVFNASREVNYSNDIAPLEFSEMPFEENLDEINMCLFAPHWRVVREGVNFRGRCYNSDCKANNKIVYIQKGFYESTEGVCVLNNEIAQLECPICNHILDKKSIHGVGIYKCRLEVKAKKDGKDKLIYTIESRDNFKFAACNRNKTINDYDCIVIIVKPI